MEESNALCLVFDDFRLIGEDYLFNNHAASSSNCFVCSPKIWLKSSVNAGLADDGDNNVDGLSGANNDRGAGAVVRVNGEAGSD